MTGAGCGVDGLTRDRQRQPAHRGTSRRSTQAASLHPRPPAEPAIPEPGTPWDPAASQAGSSGTARPRRSRNSPPGRRRVVDAVLDLRAALLTTNPSAICCHCPVTASGERKFCSFGCRKPVSRHRLHRARTRRWRSFSTRSISAIATGGTGLGQAGSQARGAAALSALVGPGLELRRF